MSTENNYPHIVYSPNYLPHIYLIKNDNANNKWSILSRAYTDLGLNFTIFESFSGSQVNITNLKSNNIYTGNQMQNMKAMTNKNDSYRIDCPDDNHTQIFYNGTTMSFNNFGDWCSYKVIWQQALNNNNYDILVMNGRVAPSDHLQFKDQLSNFMNSLPDSYDVGILYLNKIRTGTFTQVQDNELISIPSNNIRWNGIFASAFSNYGMQKMLDLPYFTNAKDRQILTEAKDNNLELYKSSLDLITLFEDSSINLAYPDPTIMV